MKNSSDMICRSKQLRKNMTKEERRLWYDFLCTHPFRFRRQHPVDKYIVDFYCHDVKIAIELDGSQHFAPEGMEYDRKRTDYLQAQGIFVLRYSNADVMQNFRGVCEHINYVIAGRK